MKETKILQHQELVLKVLSGRIDDFYLAGGTALSLFYFQHRLSMDLDFFTQQFVPIRVKKIIDYLEKELKVRIELSAQSLDENSTKMMIYNVLFSTEDILKIDLVEDILDLIKKPRIVDGIKILSLEDIYMRKVYTASGTIKRFDRTGKEIFIGGRNTGKDFYDLYILSQTFMPLSEFIQKYCNPVTQEGIIHWFKTFDRMRMIDDLLTLDIAKKIDYKGIERHFKQEIDRIIESRIGEL